MAGANGESLLTVTTALAIVVEDPGLVSCIDSVRSVCDGAHPRWMPHINLVYPFIPERMFSRFAGPMQEALRTTTPFSIKFAETAFFGGGSNGGRETIHFQVDEPQVTLMAKMARGILWRKDSPEIAFKGHLTLAQFPLPLKDESLLSSPSSAVPCFKPPKKLLSGSHLRSAILEHFKKVKATLGRPLVVREVCLLARSGDGPFRVARRIPLGVPLPAQACRDSASSVVRALSPSDKGIVSTLVVPIAAKAAVDWIRRMASTGKLPKSLPALRSAIARGPCIVRVQLDVDVVLAQIIARGWVKRLLVELKSGETVAVIPKELAAKLTKKKYTREKYVKVPPEIAQRREVAKAQKKFRVSAVAPGISISGQAVARAGRQAARMEAMPKLSLFGDPEAFGLRIAVWLSRISNGSETDVTTDRTMSEAAFRRQLEDCTRVPTAAPADEVIRMLMLDRVISVSTAGVVTYDPHAVPS
jgi:hypothetical protein